MRLFANDKKLFPLLIYLKGMDVLTCYFNCCRLALAGAPSSRPSVTLTFELFLAKILLNFVPRHVNFGFHNPHARLRVHEREVLRLHRLLVTIALEVQFEGVGRGAPECGRSVFNHVRVLRLLKEERDGVLDRQERVFRFRRWFRDGRILDRIFENSIWKYVTFCEISNTSW